MADDPFADFDEDETTSSSGEAETESSTEETSASGAAQTGSTPTPPPSSGMGQQQTGGGGRSFAKELHSVQIKGQFRTFFVDMKESSNGVFFKISEKSRGGQKSTIMFDKEDLPAFIDALNEMKSKL